MWYSQSFLTHYTQLLFGCWLFVLQGNDCAGNVTLWRHQDYSYITLLIVVITKWKSMIPCTAVNDMSWYVTWSTADDCKVNFWIYLLIGWWSHAAHGNNGWLWIDVIFITTYKTQAHSNVLVIGMGGVGNSSQHISLIQFFTCSAGIEIGNKFINAYESVSLIVAAIPRWLAKNMVCYICFWNSVAFLFYLFKGPSGGEVCHGARCKKHHTRWFRHTVFPRRKRHWHVQVQCMHL